MNLYRGENAVQQQQQQQSGNAIEEEAWGAAAGSRAPAGHWDAREKVHGPSPAWFQEQEQRAVLIHNYFQPNNHHLCPFQWEEPWRISNWRQALISIFFFGEGQFNDYHCLIWWGRAVIFGFAVYRQEHKSWILWWRAAGGAEGSQPWCCW